MRRIVLLALLSLAIAAPPPALADTFEGTARVANRTIALPPGTWTKAAETLMQRGFEFGGPPSNAMNLSVSFLRSAGPRITGIVIVHLSRDINEHFVGYVPMPACQRTDLYFISVPANYPRDQDCVLLGHTRSVFGNARSPFADATREAMRKIGNPMPTLLWVTTRKSDQNHFLTINYYIAPETAGFESEYASWANNGWHKDNLDGPRRAYMERMKLWAENAQEQTRRSFRNQPVTPLPEP